MEQVKRVEIVPETNLQKNIILSQEILSKDDKKLDIVNEARVYKVIDYNGNINEENLFEVFCNSVTEKLCFNSLEYKNNRSFTHVIEKTFMPGVTDNPGKSAKEALELLNKENSVFSGKIYFIDTPCEYSDIEFLARKYLGNNLIENIKIYTRDEFLTNDRFEKVNVPEVKICFDDEVEIIKLDISDEDLVKISLDNCLALTLEEMRTIKDYYLSIQTIRLQNSLPIWPTDVELEVIAQTWSEHCKHKIFAADINYIEDISGFHSIGNKKISSLYKSFIQRATKEIKTEQNKDWLISVFKDNAGIVRYDENVDLCIKVETHNSPSALDPYGGALTGILGVNRDILGCGLGARPIANMDVFCFAHPKLASMGDEQKLPAGLMNPDQILKGVHQGVEDGGNKSGVPTVNGAMYFDNDYAGKPLVFVGTVGVMPQHLPDGRKIEEKSPKVGDHIMMIGGAIGADGIHGATFSSLELDENSPTTAVQIGDPLTQKRVLDFLIEARDEGLYSSITDNGAGGLSSSVGEMAEFTNGANLYLDRCPTKYSGLKPFEIMISESQERMTLSVNPENISRFLELANDRGVVATDIGEFNESGFLNVFFENKKVAALDLDFLHNGLPKMKLEAFWSGPENDRVDWYGKTPKKKMTTLKRTNDELIEMVESILSSPNVASKEKLVRRYDHEVQGATHLKPFNGENGHGVNNSGGIWLYPHGGERTNGALIGCGMNPRLSLYDPYIMAQVAVDEAIRNIVACGADPKFISLLDNFCWPDPVESKNNPKGAYKLGQLVRTCEGLYDACKIFSSPLVSGKDSMKNDFKGKNRKGESIKISVLPTLLITSLGKYNLEESMSSDFKKEGDLIYLVGNDSLGMLASEFAEKYLCENIVVPNLDIEMNSRLYESLHHSIKLNLINSCHDISDGGVIGALFESAVGNDLGMDLIFNNELEKSDLIELLFSETPGRFVMSVDSKNDSRFKEHFKDYPLHLIGQTTKYEKINIEHCSDNYSLSLSKLKEKWLGVF